MSTAESHRHLIAYDIANDRRRTQIAKLLERYGDRVQYSVFVVECNASRLLRLRVSLDKLIERSEDSVLICDLGRTSSIPAWTAYYLGRSRPITGSSSLIV